MGSKIKQYPSNLLMVFVLMIYLFLPSMLLRIQTNPELGYEPSRALLWATPIVLVSASSLVCESRLTPVVVEVHIGTHCLPMFYSV